MPNHPTPLELSPEKLRRVCDPAQFDFETTAELSATSTIFGQPRGTRAIEFGMGITSPGYNVYILGETGTGRTTAVRRFLEEKTRQQPVPPDWVYVNNFVTPYQPRAISLPPGQGARFQGEMSLLLSFLREDLPKAFDTEAYHDTVEQLRRQISGQQDRVMKALQQRAAAQGFSLVNTASGLVIAPIIEGRIMTPEEFEQLPAERQQAIETQQEALGSELTDALYKVRQLEDEARKQLGKLDREVAASAIEHYFKQLREDYQDQDEVLLYLDEVYQDVLDHVGDFHANREDRPEPDWRRYEVNLLVDNSQTEGAPVVVELNPTYFNLIGRIEYELIQGAMSTHFTNIKAGSLHKANGGYLLVHARDLLRYPMAWEALKRALTGREIRLQSPEAADGGYIVAKSLDPEPIPLSVKVILMGSPGLYYMLYEREEDFGELFKVKADFDTVMPRDPQHEREYALFIANRCQEENLRPFHRSAVAKVVEFSSRLCGDQDRLSTRFGVIADLLREANYWAGQNGRQIVTAADVQQARHERTLRANLVEEKVYEQIEEKSLMIATEGSVVGQVNGLSVVDMGDYAFGHPTRITARTYMGESGIVHIEREVELSGPLHGKGLLTLVGYLGGTYAQHQPLSLAASLTFEQTYGEVDGDSASSAEVYALLSSISEIPIQQGIAATGSVNQRGEIQPIGGVTEKVEGFFAICKVQGLNGQQGVIIPAANVKHLMLREEVVEAVQAGRFHVWAISTLDEGIGLIMGKPAGERNSRGQYPKGTVHHAVQSRLHELAQDLKLFGDEKEK